MPDGFDEMEYQRQYQRSRVVYRKCNFNRGSQEDMELLEWIDRQGNASAYIKRLIMEDKKKREPPA